MKSNLFTGRYVDLARPCQVARIATALQIAMMTFAMIMLF